VIYMVDHVYNDPATEPAWHEWYAGYLQRLLSVPGLDSAQRFKAVRHAPSRYLAMYSIESEAVYASEAYRNIGGGGSQSARFHHAYEIWTRNLFEGADRAPVVGPTQKLLVWDRPQPESPGALAARVMWLRSVGLHRTTPWRALVVLEPAETADIVPPADRFFYEPFTGYVEARRGVG
jgi:hypothetical protein